jgi:hypothetical protein
VKQRTRHVKLTKEEQAALDSDLDEFFGRPLSQLSQTELFDAFHHYKSKGEEALRNDDEGSAERYRWRMLGIANYGCTTRAEWLFGNLSFELTRPTVAEPKRGGKSRPDAVGHNDTPEFSEDNREKYDQGSKIGAVAASPLRRFNARTPSEGTHKSCATLAMQMVSIFDRTIGQVANKYFPDGSAHSNVSGR